MKPYAVYPGYGLRRPEAYFDTYEEAKAYARRWHDPTDNKTAGYDIICIGQQAEAAALAIDEPAGVEYGRWADV